MVLGEIRDEAQRASVIREFTAVPGTKELAATWDIVMGLTPGDDAHDDHEHHGPPPGGPRDGRRPPPPR